MPVNSELLVIAAADPQIGTWTAPNTIGTDAIRPRAKFAGAILASMQRGSHLVDMPMEYATAEKGSPAELFRKAVIRAGFRMEGFILEMDIATMATLYNRLSQIGFVVTTPAAETWDIMFIGPSFECPQKYGFLMQTVTACNKEFEIALYYGQFTPEDGQLALTADDFAVSRFNLEATAHPSFGTSITDKQKSYGYIARRVDL